LTDNKVISHHVAWKDRLGLNRQWIKDIEDCSKAHGTDEYINQVDRFRNDIINIKNGPALHDMINEEWKKIAEEGKKAFEKWKLNNPQEARIEEEVNEAQHLIRKDQAEKLYHFIIQILELNGFGFYASEYEGEFESMT